VLGISHGPPRLGRPPQYHARSTIYFVGDDTGRECRWVIKCPDETAHQDDLATPLTAEAQYEALRVLAAHFASVAPRLRVPRPVAYLPAARALAMEYVNGTSLDVLVRPRSIGHPQAVLDGVALSGRFLRHLHAVEAPRSTVLNPRALADELLELAEARLAPAGLAVPAGLLEELRRVPDTDIPVGVIRLHGDFAPVNMLLDGANAVTGIDASLSEVGPAEEDLARFLMMLETDRVFLVSAGSTRARMFRVRMRRTLLEAYGDDPRTSALLELRLIRQLCLRWLQRHNARTARSPVLSGVRKRVVDRLFAQLLVERAEGLASAPRGSVSPGSGAEQAMEWPSSCASNTRSSRSRRELRGRLRA
jgi:aminoglycoside phosphotransferase (APT) family kinase protein